MNKQALCAVAAFAALALAACGDHHGNDDSFNPIAPSWEPVSLASLSDVERELGNVSTTLTVTDIGSGAPQSVQTLGPHHAPSAAFASAQAARSVQQPRASDPNCAAGGSDSVSSGSKSRAFSYFTVTATVNYTLDQYSGCANTSSGTTTTQDGQLESGANADSSYQYLALGNLPASDTITIYTDGVDASNVPLHTQQDYYGLIEANNGSGGLDMRSNVFSTLFASQPNQADYDGSFQIGDDSGVYEVIRGGSSLNIGGTYAYASTACFGGAVTVTTPATLGLGATAAGSGLPVSGSLGLSSGRNAVTLTFNSDGSATLSGSVSGTISAADVGRILQNGTAC
jgi:hypothetical protein